MTLRLGMIVAMLAALGACAGPRADVTPVAAPIARAARAPITILVSIDGLAANRLGKGLTPRLDALAAEGAHGAMRPSFPANTFPNHMTLVTGLRPEHHGIVDNAMRDPARPGVTFKASDPATNRDPFWWDGAEPIWVRAEKAGVRSAAMFWPGSDAAIRGVRPSAWWTYDPHIPSGQRVDMVLDWARRPAENRPRLILLYLDVVDKASHNRGYDAPETRAAIAEADGAVGALADGLAAMGQPADLVVVSDHGMAPVPPEHVRPIGEVVDAAIMESITQGPLLDIFPLPGKEGAVAARLARPIPHVTCWARGALPARLRFGAHPRTPPFLCLADAGWTFVESPRAYVKGEHGFDPDDPDVAATFIARGPGIRGGGVDVGTFDNVDVHGFVARLAGLAPTADDGDPRVLDALLARP